MARVQLSPRGRGVGAPPTQRGMLAARAARVARARKAVWAEGCLGIFLCDPA